MRAAGGDPVAAGGAAVAVRWRDGGPAPGAPDAAAGAGRAGVAAAGALGRLVADSDAPEDVVVIGLRGQAGRAGARRAIRAAIQAELAALSGLAPERIALHTPEGQAPHALLDTPGGQRRAWLAISHDGALSLAALSLRGPVGIDVSQVLEIPDWEALARDFLGPALAARLAALPAGARADALARAWSAREARLKCLGRALVEWGRELERELAVCRCLPLALPAGHAGVLALAPA